MFLVKTRSKFCLIDPYQSRKLSNRVAFRSRAKQVFWSLSVILSHIQTTEGDIHGPQRPELLAGRLLFLKQDQPAIAFLVPMFVVLIVMIALYTI